ncbi:MAG: hypothetical protein ACPGVX_00050, partial [Thalassobaculaceae bacterium]
MQSPSRAEYAETMRVYQDGGVRLAAAIGNRGPIRWAADGTLHPDIRAAYWKHGFYIFENVIDAGEIDALRADAADMIERAPVSPEATVVAAVNRARSGD